MPEWVITVVVGQKKPAVSLFFFFFFYDFGLEETLACIWRAFAFIYLMCLRDKVMGGIILLQPRGLLVVMHNPDAVQKLKFE